MPVCWPGVPYGGRRAGAFGLAGFLCDRYVNRASSVTPFDIEVTDSTIAQEYAMYASTLDAGATGPLRPYDCTQAVQP